MLSSVSGATFIMFMILFVYFFTLNEFRNNSASLSII